MTEQQAIEQAFLARVLEIEGVTSAVDHEPEQAPPLPAVTLVAYPPREGEPDLAGVCDVFWSWTVSLIVPNRAWKDSQEQIKLLLPELLEIPRADRTLGGACDWAEIQGSGDEPEPQGDKGKRVLRATATLTAETVGTP